MLRLVALVCALAAAARSCDVCAAGRCQRRTAVMHGFQVTDQMAIDRAGKVLYVQLESDLNVAYDFNELVIRRVQKRTTSGLTVDQETGTLYTADQSKILYSYQPGGSVQVASTGVPHEEADLMFYEDVLYYTIKCCSGLYYIKNEKSYYVKSLSSYTITDFVVNKNNTIYFVSDGKVYVSYNRDTPKVIAAKKHVLSIDKFNDVYLGDATLNVIFKLDDSDEPVEYAAYGGGTVDRFVFDDNNNIVFYDATNNTVAYWQPTLFEHTKCAIEPPHDKYVIKVVSEPLTFNFTFK